MSHYITGKRSTDKKVMIIEPPHLKSGRRDRIIRSQGTSRQLCLPSAQFNRGAANKPAANEAYPSAVGSEQKKIVKLMDVSLRTRLIHLLGIKPYTKAELCDRITKEGIDERSRCVLMMILKQLTYFEDGVYYLRSCFRSEIQGNWPYYTGEEQAMLDKQKLQSATQGSSDESSESQQSSVNAGSPPLIRPATSKLTYNLLDECNDVFLRRKTRIYPYRKPVAVSNDNATTCSGNEGRTADNNNNNNTDQQGVVSGANNASSVGIGENRSNVSSAFNTSVPSSKRKCEDTNGKISVCIPTKKIKLDNLGVWTSQDTKMKMLVSIPISKIQLNYLKDGVTLSQ